MANVQLSEREKDDDKVTSDNGDSRQLQGVEKCDGHS